LKDKYILASKSPRRVDLLKLLDIEFEIIPANINEVIKEGLSFEEVVEDIALQKAKYIANRHPESTVIGFDTLVIVDNIALGKPKDKEEAKHMLKRLSGRVHKVITGCAVVKGDYYKTIHNKADVEFYKMTDSEIKEYVNTGEPFDKAGAYGIQGYAARYIKKINGDFYSVMGVPLSKLYRLLRG
jgi:septum formation protein